MSWQRRTYPRSFPLYSTAIIFRFAHPSPIETMNFYGGGNSRQIERDFDIQAVKNAAFEWRCVAGIGRT